ncbi:Fur-regulated basic protein FbpA [Bacillus thuringiensis]|uniref:Fur-regulated basic protein FbpA n=1 Tax=Bacillus thuringiensis serovar andalousiensis TaxID=257985 RepID=A0A6H0TH26_BACTU|nr:Fur-regulated basic protein FbpA [Bacillus thuringiensis]QIW19038.1 Fur-regulated basic protein FbpA [Bacillus thuringiensis serovar andalousiensis]
MLLLQEVERRKLFIIRKLLGLGIVEINGQTLDQLTLTQLEGILIASLQVLEGAKDAKAVNNF